jgi:hypothetical protein
MKTKFVHFLKTANIGTLTYGPLVFGLIFFFGGLYVTEQFLHASYNICAPIVMLISCGFISLSGAIQIYRRETPGMLKPFRGVWPIVQGIGLVLLFGGIAVYCLYLIILELAAALF